MSSPDKPVFLVIGAGAGIGANCAVRFAAGGYHSVMARRSDKEGLQRWIDHIEDAGGSASGTLMNAAEDGSIEALVEQVEEEIGPIECALYNLGAQIGDRRLEDTPHKTFELGWRLGTYGLFRLAKVLMPKMEARGKGTLLVTSATSAMRGNAGQHSHAAAMGGRRMLCQSLNAQYAPLGVHVAHILIDGPVDAPDTLGKILADKYAEYKSTRGPDGMMDPAALADTYYHLAQQPKNAWTHELDLRPYNDTAWWNH